MKRLLLSGLLGVVLLPRVVSAQLVSWTNTGTIFDVTNIPLDMVNFVNKGIIGTPIGAVPVGVAIPNEQLGVFPIITTLPFKTSDTLNYTNRIGNFPVSGTMVAAPGWEFDLNGAVGDFGKPSNMSANFFEDNGAMIGAIDYYPALLTPCSVTVVQPSFLGISATNITIRSGVPGVGPGTRASLIVGPNGLMALNGKNVQLARSGLEVLPVWNEVIGSFVTSPPTNFIPDIAIQDEYWAQASFGAAPNNLASAALWNGSVATAPPVASPPLAGPPNNPLALAIGEVGFSLPFPFADSYITVPPRSTLNVILTNFTGSLTNVTGTNLMTNALATNIIKGAAFVGAPPGLAVTIGFTPAQNNFDAIGVLLIAPITNTVTASAETASIFFQDTLGSRGAQGLSVSEVGCANPTDRPGNYLIDRLPTSPGAAGTPNASDCRHVLNDPNFFLDSGAGCIDTINIISDSVTNTSLTAGSYSAYSPFIDNVVSRPPPIVGGTVTNLPGRISISADTLDLTKTRMRAEGQIIIQTPQLISSSNAVIDCENLSFSLNSTNGNLNVQSLVPPSVSRLRGPIYTWSALWNNQAFVIFTNNYSFSNVVTGTNIVITTDTNGLPVTNTTLITNVFAFPSLLTNLVNMGLHTLMLDAYSVATALPVNVYDMSLLGSNVVINDSMSVAQSLFVGGQSLTINGSLVIPGSLPPDPVTGLVPPSTPFEDWTAANAPNLLFFTNNGSFFIPNDSHFGDDRAAPYSAFVNAGTISAGSISLASAYFENDGALAATVGPLLAQGGVGKLQNGSSTSAGDTEFFFNSLKFNNYQLTAAGALNFNVTGSLFDAGPAVGVNTFQVQNGFNMYFKPPTGDLLASTFQTIAIGNPSVQVNHTWAGEDRGPFSAGYQNNEALGKLVLMSQSSDPLFFFTGAGANNAIYVDVLDISNLGTNYLNEIAIDNNLVIYYAAAIVGFTPPPPAGLLAPPQEPEEFLNGQFNGHLRWVTNFAGPNSSVPVVIDGQSVLVNRALRFATTIDSCNAGVPNYANPNPCSAMLDDPPAALASKAATYLIGQNSMSGGSSRLTFPGTGSSQPVLSAGFASAAGTYNGLFFSTNGVTQSNAGFFHATVTKNGRYSAKIQLGNGSYSLSGKFNPASGLATNTLARQGLTPLTVNLQWVNLVFSGADQICGSVSDGSWVAELMADRQVGSDLHAGKYTVLISAGTDTNGPAGNGVGTLTVSKSGDIQWKGTLADGIKVSQKSGLSAQGMWPLYNSLYGGNGALVSWIQFNTNHPESDLSGQLVWMKQAGFTNEVLAVGSLYTPRALNLTNCNLIFNGGSLGTPLTNRITSQLKKAGSWAGTSQLSLNITTSSGLFSGNVVNPQTGNTLPFQGALFEKANIGAGFFVNTNQNGQIYLAPSP